MKLMISALIAATACAGFCFWFLEAMSYTNPHPFTTITLDRDKYWWVEYMVDAKKKANRELRTIEYVHKHGRFINIIKRAPAPVIKRPYDGRGEKPYHVSIAQEHPAPRRLPYFYQEQEDGDTILMEDGTVIVVEDDICGNDWDPIPRPQKKLKTEPFYVDPSSIPEIMRNPGNYRGDKEKSNENAD